MAEAALFSIASKILSTVSSPAFEIAYERACSVWDARDELNRLKMTIATIQAVLLDAERKQNDSEAVKIWMRRVKDVLYDADDLFDEVSTDDKLRNRKKVRVSCSWLNMIVSNDSVAKKVKSLRKCLLEISEDMRIFDFAVCLDDKLISRMREGRDPGSFVDSKSVIGRDKDKEAIMRMLLDESEQDVQVIAIVGIGGMGKTTLTQLVYNDRKVEMNFEERWFTCISDSCTDIEILGKIFRSIDENYGGNFSVSVLQSRIEASIKGKKCLLVLDDVWDDDRARWERRMSLLCNGAKGSKIIVSTRSEVVARAVNASEIHKLCGLSEEDSWDLFKSVVCLAAEQEKDPRRMNLGRDIVKKCANVPLAIKSTASLLYEKNTIQEWETISKEKLPWLGDGHKDGVMPVLMLSYEYLPSNLKHCFAYCSLFPKDRNFDKDELINLWIAQGYINPVNENQVVEEMGHSYFMYLLRRSFFQMDGEAYKMHDLMHDLAIHVSGEEISLLSDTSSNYMIGIRHTSVVYAAENTRVPLETLHSLNRQRSFLFMTRPTPFFELDQCIQFASWKSLRALKLSGLVNKNIRSSIWKLKQLRYLDISSNNFKELPDSITKLVNLCTLNISYCALLESLPSNFGKLVSLRHLYNKGCALLNHFPRGFEMLTCLQHLSEFRVLKATDGGVRFPLDGLSRLQLTGALKIMFIDDTEDWDGLECWYPPLNLDKLEIYKYKGIRIPNWESVNLSSSSLPKLTSLHLYRCPSVKCLPSFRQIPNLKTLHLRDMGEFEYIQEEALFIPDLERLVLNRLRKLKGWSRKVCSKSTLPASLTFVAIVNCPEVSFSRAISDTASSCLEHWSFPGESLSSLRHLKFYKSMKLKKVELPPSHLNNLEELELLFCQELELWDENERGVDWDSLPKLRKLIIEEERVPSSDRLPNCLRRRQELANLDIIGGKYRWWE